MPKKRAKKTNNETIVIALGGNTLLRAGEKFSIHQEVKHIEEACREIRKISNLGHRIVITHGNGPQVGDILLQQKMSAKVAPPMPLDVCGAQTQGEIGYLLQRTFRNILNKPVITVVTQTLVNDKDPAFKNPTKFIGPFFKSPANGLKKDSNRGYRRVVASPEPRRIIESNEIKKLVQEGFIVIAGGGGGVPVVRRRGKLEGIEAVVDKDLASEKLAIDIGADTLLILTDVDGVYLNYGRPSQRLVKEANLREVEKYAEQGHFAAGSMGPKIQAAYRFVKNGGKRAIITSPSFALRALGGSRGTTIRSSK
ncbi:carbamate kinase [Candidatus Aenigmatarchaeota archaeon]